jgi:predicted aspartyl protease
MVMALIDTGCNQSVISLRVFNKLKSHTFEHMKMSPGSKMAATVANGQKMEYIEVIKLKFQTCKTDVCLKTYVCPQLGYQLVLGTDFLLQNRLNIDFENRKIKRIFDSTLTVSKFAKIPTNCAITLYTKIAKHATEGESIFEPHPKWIAKGILIPKQLVTIDHKKSVIPIKITNCTEKIVYILKGKTLGKLKPLSYNEKPLGPLSESGDELMPKSILKTMNNLKYGPKIKKQRKQKTDFDEFRKYFDFSKSVLTKQQREKLLELLYEFEDLFVKKIQDVQK